MSFDIGPFYIMWLRQLKRYIRSRARIVGALGQPLLFLVALGFGFGQVFQQAGQGNYLEFLAPGIIAMSILFTAMFNGIEVIWDRQFGFLKESLVAPVSRSSIMVGRTLGGATVATIQGTIVALIAIPLGFRITNYAMIPLALLFMFLLALLWAAVGTAIASRLEDMQAFQLIMNFLILPIFFLSGAIFPIADLPSALNIVVRLNPLTYGVDGVRAALIGTHSFNLGLDLGVMVGVTALVWILGTWLFRKIQI